MWCLDQYNFVGACDMCIYVYMSFSINIVAESLFKLQAYTHFASEMQAS